MQTPLHHFSTGLVHREFLYLHLPQNKHLFTEEKELSALLLKGIESGAIPSICRNDSLNMGMPNAEWKENLKLETSLGSEEVGISLFTGRDASVISITWKKIFNAKGEILEMVPHSIGLYIRADMHPTGLEMLVGYLSFNDVQQFLKKSPEAAYSKPKKGNLATDLASRNYFSYFMYTSGIASENEVVKNK